MAKVKKLVKVATGVAPKSSEVIATSANVTSEVAATVAPVTKQVVDLDALQRNLKHAYQKGVVNKYNNKEDRSLRAYVVNGLDIKAKKNPKFRGFLLGVSAAIVKNPIFILPSSEFGEGESIKKCLITGQPFLTPEERGMWLDYKRTDKEAASAYHIDLCEGMGISKECLYLSPSPEKGETVKNGVSTNNPYDGYYYTTLVKGEERTYYVSRIGMEVLTSWLEAKVVKSTSKTHHTTRTLAEGNEEVFASIKAQVPTKPTKK